MKKLRTTFIVISKIIATSSYSQMTHQLYHIITKHFEPRNLGLFLKINRQILMCVYSCATFVNDLLQKNMIKLHEFP